VLPEETSHAHAVTVTLTTQESKGEQTMTIEGRVDALEQCVTRYRGATMSMALVGKKL